MLRQNPNSLADDELISWLDHLVSDQVPEGSLIEYKQELNLDRPIQRKEAAKDASAFANQFGGTIVYGIAEEAVNGSNVPAATGHGFECGPDLDDRLLQILSDVVRPHLIDLSVRIVTFGSESALILWIGRSPLKPHMAQGYGDKRFYTRSGAESRRMDEHEVARAYQEREAVAGRANSFVNSEWAKRPLLIPPKEGHVWAARYVAVPTGVISDEIPQVPEMPKTWRLDQFRWRPAPGGIETDYEIDFRTLPTPTSTVVWWPLDSYLLTQEGAVVCWDQALFAPTDEISSPQVYLWDFVNEAERLKHFLDLTARANEAQDYAGPVRLIVEPSRVEDGWDRFLSEIQITFGPVHRMFRSPRGGRLEPLNYPPRLMSADLMCSTTEIRDDPIAVVRRIFRRLLRFFGRNDFPDGWWPVVEKTLAEHKKWQE